MKEFTYTITDPSGIHARPAGLLVKEATKFASDIIIKKGDHTGDLKRIFAVMALGAKQGDTVSISVTGNDEVEAAAEVQSFFKANL